MKFVIITGVSGSGKSQALKYMEDMGYFCVDNLPPMLLGNLAEACMHSSDKIDKAAVVMDIRGGEFFNGIFEALAVLDEKKIEYEIVYLDAGDDVLIKRYKETRHQHPLEGKGTLSDGISKEKDILFPIKERANFVIDTTDTPLKGLREKLMTFFAHVDSDDRIHITIVSFGFKRGIPPESDMVFDVRFLPNPYYLPDLRDKTGLDKEVQDFLLDFDETKIMIYKLNDLIRFVMPIYAQEIKNNLTVAIGCTGGMHRSVFLAQKLKENLEPEYSIDVVHRDLDTEEKRVKIAAKS